MNTITKEIIQDKLLAEITVLQQTRKPQKLDLTDETKKMLMLQMAKTVNNLKDDKDREKMDEIIIELLKFTKSLYM